MKCVLLLICVFLRGPDKLLLILTVFVLFSVFKMVHVTCCVEAKLLGSCRFVYGGKRFKEDQRGCGQQEDGYIERRACRVVKWKKWRRV